MVGEQEVYFPCPFCGESISMLFDTHHSGQKYIEDCEVCCRPIEVSFRVINDDVEVVAHRSH